MPLRICLVSSEVAPFAKTGGLADVSAALPRQLTAMGHDVRIFLPLYSRIGRASLELVPVATAQGVPVKLGSKEFSFDLLQTTLPNSSTPVYLIDCPALYDRPTLYTYGGDEHLRFLLLQRATIESLQRLPFAPDILQCNDWHAGLMPLMLKTTYAWDKLFAGTRSLMSVHNIGYQGVFNSATATDAGLADELSKLDQYDLGHQRINWLKEGIRHADRVATVSPTYAQEICGPLGGHGLDLALRGRGDAIAGILNGVDYDDWNPATDALLPKQYSVNDVSGKALVKEKLIERSQLHVALDTPLIGMVSRLTSQKGFDLLFDSLPEILRQRELAIVMLGSGEPRYEEFFASLAANFPERVAFHRGYSEEIAHWIEAGSDMFLMPSLYEPCGLNQMYSLKYGTVPIVRRTGGLADSVTMWNGTTRAGTGIVFNDFDLPAIRWALHTALDLFKDKAAWMQLMRNGMAQDFSWEQQAREYVALYDEMLAKPRR